MKTKELNKYIVVLDVIFPHITKYILIVLLEIQLDLHQFQIPLQNVWLHP